MPARDDDELWTRHDIAVYLGIQVGSVNSFITRHGIRRRRVSRDRHGRTVNLYRADAIRAARPPEQEKNHPLGEDK